MKKKNIKLNDYIKTKFKTKKGKEALNKALKDAKEQCKAVKYFSMFINELNELHPIDQNLILKDTVDRILILYGRNKEYLKQEEKVNG